MFFLLTTVFATLSYERKLEEQNRVIFHQLKKLADSDYFSKVKLDFYELCPNEVHTCDESICAVPQADADSENDYIDLLTIKESYSKVSKKTGPVVWKSMYDISKDNTQVYRLLSGLHFSVTTHLTAFYRKVFNTYYSNPLVFQKKFKREYKENYLYLYTVIRAAIANLSTSPDDIPQPILKFGYLLRKMISDERQALNNNNEIGKLKFDNIKATFKTDVLDESKSIEGSKTKDFLDSLPKINSSAIEIVSQYPTLIACLECEKCKLWGTIQSKGIKSAIKALNGIRMSKNDMIFLINLFRQLSITMIESRKMENSACTKVESFAKDNAYQKERIQTNTIYSILI